jgi:hypothetical protein
MAPKNDENDDAFSEYVKNPALQFVRYHILLMELMCLFSWSCYKQGEKHLHDAVVQMAATL